MNIDAGLQEARQQVEAALIGKKGEKGAKGGLGKLCAHLAESVGKGVRAKLLLYAAMDAEGRVPATAPKAAASIELLHMATLIHDDVIDNAHIRRGRPTLHKQFGNKNAILCGDYLLSLSIAKMAGLEINNKATALLPRLSKTLAAICQGEYLQHVHNGNIDMPVFTYLQVISGKTAALFYISALIGALVGEEQEKTALALGHFGRQLGLVFQIVDDCKDYEWSETAAQKPVGSDPQNGVITLPLILALGKNAALRQQAKAVIQDQAAAAPLLAAVRENKGPALARRFAQRLEQRAQRLLAHTDIAPLKREALLSMFRGIIII